MPDIVAYFELKQWEAVTQNSEQGWEGLANEGFDNSNPSPCLPQILPMDSIN